ncbi:hypothetical protein ACFFV7_45010 [Nonomuraea spiralis]|uniref:Uncharacterized protein n=1 Tax=Nonomuraea spiralis TaxID=46182 RepID=A0ABV5IV40_9ACTN|nr:hypothetical protein [Nonomuraea spiralis]GGS82309.1 hypothetical protein GCM10010176_027200 [Nonomuraea spiralis]
MKRILAWIGVNVDILVALAVAVVVSVLDVAGIATAEAVSNATVATLAVLAFVMLRSRMRAESAENTVERAVQAADRKIDLLPSLLQEQSAVRLVKGEEFNRVLAEARGDTDRWIFKGSTGAYVRAVTLPECLDKARQGRRALLIRLEILDPDDLGLCERFVRLHQSLALSPDSPESTWTGDGTRKELYATVLSACWHQQRYELLDVEIGFSSIASTFRYELSSRHMFITQRGPDFPATVITGNALALDCWATELHASLRQARSLDMRLGKEVTLSYAPTADEVRALFDRLGLAFPGAYGDDDIDEIIGMAFKNVDPYDKAAAWG